MRANDPEETCRGPRMTRIARWTAWCCLGLVCLVGSRWGFVQETGASLNAPTVAPHAMRTRRFLAGRTVAGGTSAARAMDAARREHLAMAQAQVSPRVTPL